MSDQNQRIPHTELASSPDRKDHHDDQTNTSTIHKVIDPSQIHNSSVQNNVVVKQTKPSGKPPRSISSLATLGVPQFGQGKNAFIHPIDINTTTTTPSSATTQTPTQPPPANQLPATGPQHAALHPQAHISPTHPVSSSNSTQQPSDRKKAPTEPIETRITSASRSYGGDNRQYKQYMIPSSRLSVHSGPQLQPQQQQEQQQQHQQQQQPSNLSPDDTIADTAILYSPHDAPHHQTPQPQPEHQPNIKNQIAVTGSGSDPTSSPSSSSSFSSIPLVIGACLLAVSASFWGDVISMWSHSIAQICRDRIRRVKAVIPVTLWTIDIGIHDDPFPVEEGTYGPEVLRANAMRAKKLERRAVKALLRANYPDNPKAAMTGLMQMFQEFQMEQMQRTMGR